MRHRTDALLTLIAGLLAVLTGETVESASMRGLGSVLMAIGLIWLVAGTYLALVARGRKNETPDRG